MESESNYPQTYTVSGVADSLGIPVNTLRTWCQRGFGPRVNNVEASGEWRRYSAEQVAEFAALKRLSAMIELHPAQMAIWDIVDTQAEEWRDAVRNARLRPGPMLIGIVRYQGVEAPLYFLYAGNQFQAFATTMAEPLEAGCEGRDEFCSVQSLLVMDVGAAVSAAMQALK